MGKAEEQTEYLLRQLYQVFKDGYRPARGIETYGQLLKNHVETYDMVNCLGHVFNLRNQQYNDYKFKAFQIYGYFPGLKRQPDPIASQRLFDFIKETGLKIEECDPNKPIEDFKSWKCALYFGTDEETDLRDFHFLLEDAPYIWSSKIGFEPFVEQLRTTKLPMTYHSLLEGGLNYQFYGAYKITNPNADENNRYVRNYSKRQLELAFPTRKRHIIIDGQVKKNELENLLDRYY